VAYIHLEHARLPNRMINPRSTAFRVGSSVSGSSKGVQTCLTAPRLHNNSSSSRRGAQTARIRVDCHAAKRSQETILAAEDLDFDHLAVATDRTTDLGAAFRGGTGGGGGWQNDEYQLNYGRAVRTLRADLPHLLDRPLEVRPGRRLLCRESSAQAGADSVQTSRSDTLY
jgi:hypothetical protein